MSKIETMSPFAVVKGYESNYEVVSKRFVNTSRDNSENTIGYNFLSVAIDVAWDAFTALSRENGNLNPAFLRFRKVISS